MIIDDMRQELAYLGNGAHALAIQILGNADDAADAVQDALAQALRRSGQYRPERGPLKAWFLGIVRHRCIDLLRRRKPESDKVDEIAAAAPGPEELAERAQESSRLQQAIARLPAEQRQIIVLRDYMDLSYAEIATVLEIAPGTVMSRLHRSRVALANIYRENYER